jgi:hypothetical protein
MRGRSVVRSCLREDQRHRPIPVSFPGYAPFGVTATGSWANGGTHSWSADGYRSSDGSTPLREPQRAPGSNEEPIRVWTPSRPSRPDGPRLAARTGCSFGMEAGRYGGTTGREIIRSPSGQPPCGRRPIDNQGLLMEAARRLRQRATDSSTSWQANHHPTSRTPAESAAASCCAPFQR